MPNSNEHLVAGGVIGLAVIGIWEFLSQSNAIKQNPDFKYDGGELIGKMFAGALVGSIAGLLPDILEPATNPCHRQFVHSKTAVFLLVAGMLKISVSKMDIGQKQIAISALTGILSHHYKDSQTPFGLPNY